MNDIRKFDSLSKHNIYIISKDKTIPMIKEYKENLPCKNKIFDEEIIINTDGIYVDNRIHITIFQEREYLFVYSIAFEETSNCLCYSNFTLSKNEFREFKSIEEFIDKVFIKGEKFMDRGVGVATGLTKENFKDKDIAEDFL